VIAEVIRLSGTVIALNDAELSVSTSGLVVELKVDAGDRVERGQELLTLDEELARYQYNSARAALTRAQHALDDARRRHEEAKVLAPQRSIAESVVKDLAAEVLEDEAALEEARANAGYRKGVLERHRLLAPFTGVISSRSVELGEWVTPGQAVLRLVSTDNLRLDFQVPEDYLGQVEAGALVDYSLGAQQGRVYRGTVRAAVPVTEQTLRTFLLRVQPQEQPEGMRPGMSAQVQAKINVGRTGVAVPRDAVLRYADGRVVVWVVEESTGRQIATERIIEAGLSFNGLVEVQQGLRKGEMVVIRGNESLRNGQAVSVTEEIGP
jgi:RND family efflux transporter MFP subunit